jgi:hypothetical protein
MDYANKLTSIGKKNRETLENLKKFVELVDNIEMTLTGNIQISINEMDEMKKKLDENLELFYKISKDLLKS